MILTNSYTIFLVPFKLTPEQINNIENANSIWKKDADIKPQSNLFHSYIEERFNSTSNKQDIVVYSLADDWKQQISAVEGGINISNVINTKWTHHFANEKLNSDEYPEFRFGKEKIYQPHLWLVHNEGVGLLSIGIQAQGKNGQLTGDMLVNMNYALNKLDKQASQKYNLCYEKRIKDGDGFKSVTMGWDMNQIVNAFFLATGIERKPMRMHPLTYALALPESCEGAHYTQEDITKLTKQLMYAVNGNYKMDTLQSQESEQSILRTFDGITFGSAIEATCVIVGLVEGTKLKDEDNRFFNQFHTDSFPKRYLWLFLLAYMQQLTLREFLQEIIQMSDKYTPEAQEVDQEFWQQMHRIAYVKSRNHYSEVSTLHQHNMYYDFISRTLGLDHFVDEIDMKTKAFRLVLDRHNEQRRTKEEEKRMLAEQKNAQLEHRITIFSLFLAIMCIVQAIDSIYTIIDVFNTGFDGGLNSVKIYASVITLVLTTIIGWLTLAWKRK